MSALLETYKKLPLKLVKGKGSWVEDDQGRRFLDLYGGHAVAALGHCHPRLVRALQEQAGKLLFYSNVVGLEHQEEAAAALVAALPSGLDKVFFVNSGAEAVESSLKIARGATGRTAVLSFDGSFHGRSLGALSATGLEKYRATAGVTVPGHVFVPWGDIEAVATVLSTTPVAAVLLEPVQSLAGIRAAPAEFFQELRALCTAYGTLLIYDELQTGMGRIGTFTFAPNFGVTPDLMTLGKGLGGGFPVAACVASAAVAATLKPGDLGSTFGGGPLASAAVLATVSVLLDEGLVDNAAARGAELKAALTTFPGVKEVRGQGLLLGIELVAGDAARWQKSLLERGVITGTSEHKATLRLMPPLCLAASEVALFLSTFASVHEVLHASS